jgi:hypothetical protein
MPTYDSLKTQVGKLTLTGGNDSRDNTTNKIK